MNAHHKDMIARLADEEVPVRVIARALEIPADEVTEVIQEAIADGKLVRSPRYDWHPDPKGVLSSGSMIQRMEEAEICSVLSRVYSLTRLEAAMFNMLVRRNEVCKEALHGVIEHCRKNTKRDETDPKMVDVMIHKLRTKLRPHGIEIKTLWGSGYYMEPAMRQKVQGRIHEHITTNGGVNAVRPDTGRTDDIGPAGDAGEPSNV